jgi:hypothetical protein
MTDQDGNDEFYMVAKVAPEMPGGYLFEYPGTSLMRLDQAKNVLKSFDAYEEFRFKRRGGAARQKYKLLRVTLEEVSLTGADNA